MLFFYLIKIILDVINKKWYKKRGCSRYDFCSILGSHPKRLITNFRPYNPSLYCYLNLEHHSLCSICSQESIQMSSNQPIRTPYKQKVKLQRSAFKQNNQNQTSSSQTLTKIKYKRSVLQKLSLCNRNSHIFVLNLCCKTLTKWRCTETHWSKQRNNMT